MRKFWIVPALVVVTMAAWAWSASATTQPRTFSLIEVSVPKNDRPSASSRSIAHPRAATSSS